MDGKRSQVNKRQVPARDNHGPFVALELQMLHKFQSLKETTQGYNKRGEKRLLFFGKSEVISIINHPPHNCGVQTYVTHLAVHKTN